MSYRHLQKVAGNGIQRQLYLVAECRRTKCLRKANKKKKTHIVKKKKKMHGLSFGTKIVIFLTLFSHTTLKMSHTGRGQTLKGTSCQRTHCPLVSEQVLKHRPWALLYCQRHHRPQWPGTSVRQEGCSQPLRGLAGKPQCPLPIPARPPRPHATYALPAASSDCNRRACPAGCTPTGVRQANLQPRADRTQEEPAPSEGHPGPVRAPEKAVEVPYRRVA